MKSIKTKVANGLVINHVNISSAIQIILTKFVEAVVSLPLILFLNALTLSNFFSLSIMLQTFDAKYLHEFKPIFVVLKMFLKNRLRS